MSETQSSALTWDLIERYLASDVSSEEKSQVEQLLAGHPLGTTVTMLRELPEFVDLPERHDFAVQLDKLHHAMRATNETNQSFGTRSIPAGSVTSPKAGRRGAAWGTRTARPLVGYAIATAVMAAVGVMVVSTIQHGTFTQSPSITRAYVTAPGQHATVTLADGSQAVLGPATKLSVTSASGAGTTATVMGEVLFTVQHRTQRPFVVHTNNAVTRVLGTTFFVRRYDTDRATRVVVADGRVSLHGNSVATGKSILDAHTLGVVNDSGHIEITPNVAVNDYTSWTRGKLVFRDTPVRDMIADLGRSYDVDLRLVDSSFADRKLTWVVPVATLSLKGMLDALMVALDAHYTRSGRVVTIASGKPSFKHHLPSTFTSEPQYGR